MSDLRSFSSYTNFKEESIAMDNIIIQKYLYFKGEISFHILHNKDENRQFDTEILCHIGWASDVGSADVVPDQFKHQRLNVIICRAFYMSIADLKSNCAIRRK